LSPSIQSTIDFELVALGILGDHIDKYFRNISETAVPLAAPSARMAA
jgi:hypothetical protein